MTSEEQNTVIQELKSAGISGAKYSDSYSQFYLCDIPAKKGRRELYIKEKSLSIGFYGCEYEIMREWADKEIKVFVENQFPAWEYFRRDTENPDGNRAVWFNLRRTDDDDKQKNWYGMRTDVLNVAVQLYKKLEGCGVFSDNFDAKTFQGNSNSMLKGMKDTIKLLLENNFNVILTGAPGTGKTYTAREVAKEVVGAKVQDDATEDQKKKEEERIASVQFHPGYDYSDFVIGMKPVLICGGKEVFRDALGLYIKEDESKEEYDEKNIAKRLAEGSETKVSFRWKDGVFKKFADKAKDDLDHNYVFLIDEINRADLSRVFGELFSLLEEEYRYYIDDKEKEHNKKGITLPNGEPFVIPKNLYIIGTMNDIDRSVESMDFALRRRFAWYEVKPEDTADAILSKVSRKETLMAKMAAVNRVIISGDSRLGSEYQLGGAIFSKFEKYAGQSESDCFACLWNNHIENILKEYLRGRGDKDVMMEKLKNEYDKAKEVGGEEGAKPSESNQQSRRTGQKISIVLSDGNEMCEDNAVDTFKKFIGYVYTAKKDDGVKAIMNAGIRRGRLPLIVNVPPKPENERYYQKIEGEYYLHTYSTSDEKADFIRQISELLGLDVSVSLI